MIKAHLWTDSACKNKFKKKIIYYFLKDKLKSQSQSVVILIKYTKNMIHEHDMEIISEKKAIGEKR